jgi:hypothetical protein
MLHTKEKVKVKDHLTPESSLVDKNDICYFGQVPVIRRCDIIFWKFYGR